MQRANGTALVQVTVTVAGWPTRNAVGSTVIAKVISVAGRGALILSRNAGVSTVSPSARTAKGGTVRMPVPLGNQSDLKRVFSAGRLGGQATDGDHGEVRAPPASRGVSGGSVAFDFQPERERLVDKQAGGFGRERTAISARAAGSHASRAIGAQRDEATDAHQFFSTLAPARAAFCLARCCWLAASSAMISAGV